MVGLFEEPNDYKRNVFLLTMFDLEKINGKNIDSNLNTWDQLELRNLNTLGKIIDIIRKNSWDKNFLPNSDIHFSTDFKEICKTPIMIPTRNSLITGIFSGEYILSLLDKFGN